MKNRVNKGHYFELMDRLNVIMSVVQDHLILHPVSENNKKIEKKLKKTLDLLWESYQIVGHKNFENHGKKEPIGKVIFRRHKKSKN